ncbi:YggS family pyridoxal phosphate-dependent enzyme [Glaciibacter superstes]|uniref:YggS family pyridoxal phosphate-dependent enzyme n=1 Tax=Glaciibacter superstes TaxID=501023 RepID=UPI0003B795C3|nr:YggS family pyridoxal phosphate-dependent enzyme [Glaciibacter superstes]
MTPTTWTSPISSSENLSDRLESVRAGITDAAASAGRSAESITTVVITKFQPASLIIDLAHLGVRDFGENRHQEAQAKAAELADLGLTWHFVGQVQGKKARAVRTYASVIHSVDRTSLVNALSSPALTSSAPSSSAAPEVSGVDCFIQVNLTDDPARGGVAPAGLEPLVDDVLSAPGLRLLGLMAVAPLGEEPRRAFARVRALHEGLRRMAPGATALSMGMSGDYRDAILEGATHLRIGTAITGNRPDHG